ncbi:MAG: system Fe-S cluster assembly protein [Devosia sp.]|nr:system Fe-S cluster assembly protein [Devosia sp.]
MPSSRASKRREAFSRKGLDMADDANELVPDTAAPAPEAAAEEALRITPTIAASLPAEDVERITKDLIGVLKTVYDPEIPVDIYELGLIYKVDLDDDRNLTIDMTLTAPGCPVAGEMPGWVENAARSVEGIQDVTVNMVFDPPWDASRMSEEAQVALNWW